MDGGVVGVHQHGYAHTNHEQAGRKCEFGAARDADAQAADIAAGRGAPGRRVSARPSTRCSRRRGTVARATTAGAVLAAGHRVLSRDVSAGRLDVPGLAEVPVTVDWSARRKGVPRRPLERGRAIASGIAGGGPVGVMLHHAVLVPRDRAELGRLLAAVTASGRCARRRSAPLAVTARG